MSESPSPSLDVVSDANRAAELRAAIDAFLSQPTFSAWTRRNYAATLRVLEAELAGQPLSGPLIAAVLAQRWQYSAPATYNRHRAAARSFLRYTEDNDLLDVFGAMKLRRRPETEDHTRAIPRAAIARLWERRDIDLREKALWRMLYETAARASEILELDVKDIDIANKRARIRSKGGNRDFIFFQSGTARLLPRLLDGRRWGPIFQSHRAPIPARAPADGDLCPVTGRARLSYRRAEHLLVSTTGWTLHQFRHSALTHLAEDDIQLPLLMAKSRHKSLRSLQRYARPGPDAVAALTAASDPNGRRRD